MSEGDAYRSASESVAARIRSACAESGRDPGDVKIVAVTKTRTESEIHRFLAAAAETELPVHALGENRVQEAVSKQAALVDVGLPWHLVGRIQTNKVKYLSGRFSLVHGFDREDLIRPFVRRAPDVAVLVQVNTSGEASKAGVAPRAAGQLVDACLEAGIRVEGLMTMAPHGDPGASEAGFARLADLRVSLAAGGRDSLTELSMGMTDDFEAAIRHGATLIRLGRILFGERDQGR